MYIFKKNNVNVAQNYEKFPTIPHNSPQKDVKKIIFFVKKSCFCTKMAFCAYLFRAEKVFFGIFIQHKDSYI